MNYRRSHLQFPLYSYLFVHTKKCKKIYLQTTAHNTNKNKVKPSVEHNNPIQRGKRCCEDSEIQSTQTTLVVRTTFLAYSYI